MATFLAVPFWGTKLAATNFRCTPRHEPQESVACREPQVRGFGVASNDLRQFTKGQARGRMRRGHLTPSDRCPSHPFLFWLGGVFKDFFFRIKAPFFLDCFFGVPFVFHTRQNRESVAGVLIPAGCLGPPARRPFAHFVWLGGFPYENRLQKKSWYPYSNLSTGGPNCGTLVPSEFTHQVARGTCPL